MIDAYASEPQYVTHIGPVWNALPEKLQGAFSASATAARRAAELGIATAQIRQERGTEARLTIVASYMDEQHVKPRPVVLVEHGAGQSYGHDGEHNPAYPGGRGREAVCLFICPNEMVAARWRQMYPDTPTAVVGSPFLDPWHGAAKAEPIIRHDPPLVVFSFHWDCAVVPECGNAFEHYKNELWRLALMTPEERGFHMGGHAHPRAQTIMGWWRGIGVRTFNNFAEVLDYADLYVADNSSTIFEFASTDRPVLMLNAPEYRRDVEHGLRFWRAAEFLPYVDEPWALVNGIEMALGDADCWKAGRHHLTREVYAYTDGHAAQRAAAAIVATYEEGHWRAWREQRSAHNPFEPAGTAVLDGTRVAIVRRLRELGRPLEEELAERLAGATEADLQRILAAL